MRFLSTTTTLSALAGATLASSSPLGVTDAGTINGGKCSGGQDAVFYKGIPFAEPPVGELRFEPPKAYSGQYPAGGLNATSSAPACIQFGSSTVPPGEKSEDCLYLDIWTPSTATPDSNLPVKVWIFGGSDTEGGTSYPLYDGCNLAEHGAVVVALNYRLGPLGFLALESAGFQGNQGIQDLILGFEWVKQNIDAFGGDPDKVLAFGQSAGATDLYAIATLPQAPSLFKGAIIESIALPQLTATSAAQKLGTSFANTLGCSSDEKSCLQSASATDIKNAFNSDPYTGAEGGYDIRVTNSQTPKYWPIVDGTVIKENPLDRGSQVPAVFGYNQQEGTLDAISAYNSPTTIASLTAANYTSFLKTNFGSAAQRIAKYYPLAAYEAAVAEAGLTAGSGVFEAIAHILTDVHFKCPTYRSAVATAQNGNGANQGWVYEFTHNNTCAWLDTLVPIADDLSFLGAAHTAEIPFVFANLDFDYRGGGINYTCKSTGAERALGEEMISLWTAMAETGNPSTEAIAWPEFSITASGANTPGMVFGNKSTSGTIDFSVCKLWAQVSTMLDGSGDSTAAGVLPSPSGSSSVLVSPSNTASPTSAVPFEGGAASALVRDSIVLGVFVIVAAILA
ncbi:Carboxylesterase [Aspergillus germanicus]